MVKKRLVVHGVAFLRSGSCKQCGACGCGDCPHHYEEGGLHWCDVYDTREQVCAACSEEAAEEVDHAHCVSFPDHPWLYVARLGLCGFHFEREDGGSLDELPFVDGKYRLETWPLP